MEALYWIVLDKCQLVSAHSLHVMILQSDIKWKDNIAKLGIGTTSPQGGVKTAEDSVAGLLLYRL